MFDNDRYVTKEVQIHIPLFLQNLMWYMIETMIIDTKDHLQVFQFESTLQDGKPKQKIIHTQEKPPYIKEDILTSREPINLKVYVIDNRTHSTMLLASEY